MQRIPSIIIVVVLLLTGCKFQSHVIEQELAAIVDEYRRENDRFGVLFAKFDGNKSSVYTAGEWEGGHP